MMRTSAVVLPAQGPPVNTIRLILSIALSFVPGFMCAKIQKKSELITHFSFIFCTFAGEMTKIQKTNMLLALAAGVLALLCVLSILDK